MSLNSLFALPSGLEITACSKLEGRLCVSLLSTQSSSPCPLCGTAATRIHSRYQRTVQDLSVQNVQVLLHLRVRKFYCDQPACPRRIFTERLPQVTSPHGRFTFSLRQFLGQLGREQGGASAARSATLQGMQVTARARDTTRS